MIIIYGRFEYVARHYRNQRFGKKIKYRDNYDIDNLKEKENLVCFFIRF